MSVDGKGTVDVARRSRPPRRTTCSWRSWRRTVRPSAARPRPSPAPASPGRSARRTNTQLGTSEVWTRQGVLGPHQRHREIDPGGRRVRPGAHRGRVQGSSGHRQQRVGIGAAPDRRRRPSTPSGPGRWSTGRQRLGQRHRPHGRDRTSRWCTSGSTPASVTRSGPRPCNGPAGPVESVITLNDTAPTNRPVELHHGRDRPAGEHPGRRADAVGRDRVDRGHHVGHDLVDDRRRLEHPGRRTARPRPTARPARSTPTPVTSHSVTLTGLTPGATYHYKATSANSVGLDLVG